MERRRIRFVGRVQGVGFRATARAIAARHPVTGWVRNEPDASVLLELQGAPPEIAAVIDAIRNAMGGLIQGVHAHALPLAQGEDRFEVRH